MTEREERTLLAPKIELKSLLNRCAVFKVYPLYDGQAIRPSLYYNSSKNVKFMQ